MDTDSVVLSGMDGSNPLGFLAALGLLRVLDDNNVDPKCAPRLSWADHGRWLPVLHWHGDKDALLDVIEQDIVLSRTACALDL